MKKTLSFILSFLLLFGGLFIPSKTFAAGNKTNKNTKVVINEYLRVKGMQQLDNITLKKMGLSDNQIEKLKKLDYKSELTKRSKLSDDTLKNMGYTQSQIELLKKYDGSEVMTAALSASATIYSSIYSASATNFTVSFHWDWSCCPVCLDTDVIGAAWNATSPQGYQMNIAYNSSGSYHVVRYRNTGTGSTYYQGQSITRKDDYHLVGLYFNEGWTAYKDSPYAPTQYWYADYGYGQISVSATSGATVQEICMRFEYGHSQLGVTPSVEVSSSGASIGITFSWFVSEEDWSMHRYDRYGNTLS